MSVTISHIAKVAGVSKTTVSRVLNENGYVKEETKEKILKVIKDLNYTPSAIARSLSTNKTNTIGVIVPDIMNPFFGEVIKGISEEADSHNLNIILFDTDDNIKKELKALKLLREQRIQGIIITPTSVEDEFNSEYLSALENLGIPVVLVEGHVKYSNFSGVFMDNIKGAFQGTEALIKAGHKNIGIITGRMSTQSAKDRFIGYKKALAFHGLNLKEQYVFYGDYRQEGGYKFTKELLKMEERPTAIFTCSNLMTLGCIKAIYEEGLKVPEDIAIMGFDNLDMVNILGMNISYINGPAKEIGVRSMKILIDSLSNKAHKEIKKITLMPKLVLKGSEEYPKGLKKSVK